VEDVQTFAALVVVVAVVGILAVLSNRVSERFQVPAPALFVTAAAVAAAAIPDLHAPTQRTVERIVTVALVVILFDGGMHIGLERLRAALGTVALVGVLGTFLTVAATALATHLLFDFGWYVSLLVGTAVAPTDPAVVFSVLGKREVAEPAGTILEGESGANDPVGIALMASLVAAGGVSAGALGHVVGEFSLEMSVGLVVGVIGARALLWFMRRVPLPSEGLYSLRTLASALLLSGVATIAHGSGFLAVFVAGLLLGDERAPYKREIERFHSALASLSEIVAFVVLGLTVDLGELGRTDVWVPGLVIAVLLLVVIRPVLVGLCLLPAALRRNERVFVLFAGLKGAVPILLGSLLLQTKLPDADRYYAIVVVVVAFSVLVQGTLTPTVARLLNVKMHTVEPEPWSLGVRLRDEPEGVHRIAVAAGSRADGRRLEEIALGDGVWVSFAIRDGQLLSVHGDTELQAGDDLLILADPALRQELEDAFLRPPFAAGWPATEQ
jgi:cell volume regulation protein A